MLKAAVIGLGEISKIHIPVIKSLPNVQLAAVCDINPMLSEIYTDVPFYESARVLLDTVRPDCVHICLPHYLHYPMAKLAAQQGVNVFCEKPLAINAAEAESFVNLEKAYPALKFGLCLQNRYNKSVCEMLEIIKSGSEGKLLSIKAIVAWHRSAEYFEQAPWRGKMEEAGGGAMINQSIHTLDLMQVFAGEIAHITGQTSRLSGLDIEVEDTATAVINFKSGIKGLFFATIANARNTNVEIELNFENSTYFIRDNCLLLQTDSGYKFICEDEKLPGTKFYYGAGHYTAISRYYNSLANGTKDYIAASEGLISLQMIHAVTESSRTAARYDF